MKQVNELNLAAISSGLGAVLSEELGGEFEVGVLKFEVVKGTFGDDRFLLSFEVGDKSHFERYEELHPDPLGSLRSPDGEMPMTADRFRERAVRSANEVEVFYDVRTLQAEQVTGMTVFLQDLLSKLKADSLPISKPITLHKDFGVETTEELDGLVKELSEAGLKVSIRTP